MATKLDIINFALSHLGNAPVTSLTSNGSSVVQGNLWIDQSRQELLLAYPWIFATKRARLNEKTLNAFLRRQYLSDWLYAFNYPSDCLFMQYLISPSTTNEAYQKTELPFTIEQNPLELPGENERIILTNETEIAAVYTLDFDVYAQLPPHFVQPLSILLASHMAFPLTSSIEMKNALTRMYLQSLITYTAQDANQIKNKQPQESEIIRARESDYYSYGTLSY